MVKCEECGKKFKLITNTHLKKAHGMTPQAYLEKYPGAVLYDEKMHDRIVRSRHTVIRPECHHPECSNTVTQSWNKFCSRACASSYLFNKKYLNRQAGINNPSATDGSYSFEKSQKREARKRDEFKCQVCSRVVTGKEAHTHHLIPSKCFDSADFSVAHDLDNLTTLCERCHVIAEREVAIKLFQILVKQYGVESVQSSVKLVLDKLKDEN